MAAAGVAGGAGAGADIGVGGRAPAGIGGCAAGVEIGAGVGLDACVAVAIGAVTGVGPGAVVGAGVGVDAGAVTVGGETMSVKTAVQPTVAVIVIVPVTHVPPPNQPLNVDPAAGVASSVTNVPFG